MNLKAMHKIGYGLYVVTSKKGDRLNGQIANTVFQITSEPPTVAVSINKNNLTWEFINESRVFAVSVLCQ
ncbi:MAG: flavin reductase, partial [Dehalococcoidia bacterium]|nr:flavin reductase [Dehalococcoidia bacterium]